jgi:predicted dinucleotide-binding enzyme
MISVSIIGSGRMAEGIAGLAARAGHAVEVMGRDAGKAQALAGRIGAGVKVAGFGDVPAGDFVVLAVPYSVVLDVLRQFGDALSGKLIVDITNPINADFTAFVTPTGSYGAKEVAKAAPDDAVIVKAFNFVSADHLAAGDFHGRRLDTFIAGDDAPAKERVSAFIESLGLRPMDAGALSMAWTLEHFTMLSLGLAKLLKHADFALGVDLLGAPGPASKARDMIGVARRSAFDAGPRVRSARAADRSPVWRTIGQFENMGDFA